MNSTNLSDSIYLVIPYLLRHSCAQSAFAETCYFVKCCAGRTLAKHLVRLSLRFVVGRKIRHQPQGIPTTSRRFYSACIAHRAVKRDRRRNVSATRRKAEISQALRKKITFSFFLSLCLPISYKLKRSLESCLYINTILYINA